MRNRRFHPALLAASVLALAGPSFAQTTGSLAGTIKDATTDKPVANVVVIATSPALQGEQTAVTDETGAFEITLLPGGVYALNVQSENYTPFTQEGLTVRLDKTLKIQLKIVPTHFEGPPIEIVVTKPVIQTTNVESGANISKEQMQLIPYGQQNRNFQNVATSVAGVQADLFGISMHGSGSPEQSYIIDGVSVNDPAFGTQGTTLLQDFVQEVDVKTGGYQAEYGRSSGGVINVVTKSGSNDFHGSVFLNWSPFEAARKQVSQAGLAVGAQASQRYNLDFGVEVGGPILKDKLWFFAGFAPQIQSLNLDRIIQSRTDDGTGRPVIDPNTGAAQTNEVARQTYVNNTTSYQFTGKLTYLINENHSVALAVYGNPTTVSGAQGVGSFNEGVGTFDTQSGSTDVSLRYSGKLFNKSMLVEASAAYHHQFGGQNPSINFVDVQGVSAATLKNTPNISWRSQYNLLNPQFDDGMIPTSQRSAAVQSTCAVHANGFDPCPVLNYATGGLGLDTNVTLDRMAAVLKFSNFVELAGHHQFKYGVDAAQDTYNQQKTYTGGGAWRALDNPVARFQLFRGYGHVDPNKPGVPAFDQNNPGHNADEVTSTNTKNTSLAFFAQDTWNIFDKIVLDVGIRGEAQKMYADEKNQVDGKPGLDLLNIMPRVGLIYDWTNRGLSKVYASYGRFYEYVPLDLADRALSAETQVSYITNPTQCTDPKDPRTCAVIPGALAGGRTYSFTGGAAGDAIDPDLKGQYADEFQAGVQYQVYRDISVGVDYTRKSLGRVIEDMSTDDGNTYFLANPGQSPLGIQAVTGAGQVVVYPNPERIYDGVTLSVNKNFSDNWLLTASYTYSQFRGNYPGLFRNENGQLDPNILSEYDLVSLLPNKGGPLPGDVPNAIKADAAYVYELSPSTTLNLGANIRINQGTPLNYLGAHPLYGAGEAFILPRGSAGRLPWTWQMNLRAAAAYKISKDYTFGLSLDLFNITDNRETTAVNENYTFDSVNPIVNGTTADLAYLKNTAGAPVTLNPTFLAPTAYQLPFSARLGARFSF
ncbi:MAG: TonB-dependent receptor [Deltaproteobacteria bacterium]|nr:TonB-dependent receptor [Deltaproteobacteria bacterium]